MFHFFVSGLVARLLIPLNFHCQQLWKLVSANEFPFRHDHSISKRNMDHNQSRRNALNKVESNVRTGQNERKRVTKLQTDALRNYSITCKQSISDMI